MSDARVKVSAKYLQTALRLPSNVKIVAPENIHLTLAAPGLLSCEATDSELVLRWDLSAGALIKREMRR
jgi:2'-5' RNA ligase